MDSKFIEEKNINKVIDFIKSLGYNYESKYTIEQNKIVNHDFKLLNIHNNFVSLLNTLYFYL